MRTPHVEHSLRATHSKVPRQEMDQSWTAVSWQNCEMFYQICHSSQAMCPIRFSLSSDVRYALACRQGEFDPTSFSNHRVQLLNQVESKSPSRQAKAYRTFAGRLSVSSNFNPATKSVAPLFFHRPFGKMRVFTAPTIHTMHHRSDGFYPFVDQWPQRDFMPGPNRPIVVAAKQF